MCCNELFDYNNSSRLQYTSIRPYIVLIILCCIFLYGAVGLLLIVWVMCCEAWGSIPGEGIILLSCAHVVRWFLTLNGSQKISTQNLIRKSLSKPIGSDQKNWNFLCKQQFLCQNSKNSDQFWSDFHQIPLRTARYLWGTVKTSKFVLPETITRLLEVPPSVFRRTIMAISTYSRWGTRVGLRLRS